MHKQTMYYIKGPKGVLCRTLDGGEGGNACYEFDWVAKDQLEGRTVLMSENESDISESIGMFLGVAERQGVAVHTVEITATF